VDSTFASRALAEGVFEPYTSPEADHGPQRYAADTGHRLSAVDVGDVCVNIDTGYFASKAIPEPTSYQDLADPKYKDLLVVESPATSSPGLAFLLGTIPKFGDQAWPDYWSKLKANGVKSVSGLTEAYTQDFSGSSGKGPRPIVVSYASSPAAEVGQDGKPRMKALLDTCFRQVKYAGVLVGGKQVDQARKVVDFLLSQQFQATVATTMYVYPSRQGVDLPAGWAQVAPLPQNPDSLPGDKVDRPGKVDRPVALVDRGVGARGTGLALIALVPVGFLVVFFAWPVAAIVGRGFSAGGVSAAVTDGETWKLAGFTVAQATASTVLAVAAGLPVAFLLARVRLPGIALARTLVLVPFVLPTGCRGAGVPGAVAGRRGGVDHPGQRLFQCGRGGEDGGRALDAPRHAGRRRGAGAGCVTMASLPVGDLAVAGTGHRVRGRGGLPVLRHQFRRRADPRWRALPHLGNRDLPADGQPARPRGRGSVVAGAVRRGGGRARGRRAGTQAPGNGVALASRSGNRATAGAR
jgi:thiamine transport system substrate-binding protein